MKLRRIYNSIKYKNRLFGYRYRIRSWGHDIEYATVKANSERDPRIVDFWRREVEDKQRLTRRYMELIEETLES